MQINVNIQLDPGELAETITRLAMLFAPQPALNGSAWPDAPAPTSPPVLAPIPPATEAASTIAPLGEWTPVATQPERKPKPAAEKRPAVLPGETEKPKRVYSGDRLKFEEFDKLVRSEMKRLSLDGRIPGYRLWETERDPRLPTLGAVCQRYDVSTLPALAAKLSMLPPLSATNGVYHEKETTP